MLLLAQVGVDRQGFPVLVEKIGEIDYIGSSTTHVTLRAVLIVTAVVIAGLHAALDTEDFLTWVCWYHELQVGACLKPSSPRSAV
jgi:hypothetical protein